MFDPAFPAIITNSLFDDIFDLPHDIATLLKSS